MTVTTGRWMTGFQNIERPFNQILIRERHLDAEMRQDFTDLLMADEEIPGTATEDAGRRSTSAPAPRRNSARVRSASCRVTPFRRTP